MTLRMHKQIQCLVALQITLAVGLVVFYIFHWDTQSTSNVDGRRHPLSLRMKDSVKEESNKDDLTANDIKAAENVLKSNDIRSEKDIQVAQNAQKSNELNPKASEIQAERKALVKEYCKRMGYTTKPNWKNIAVFTYHNILYCVTPKCASRQFRRLLVSGYPYGPGEITLERFPDDQRELMLKTFFKFTVVREPFERLLSAYKDKFLFPRDEDRNLLQAHAEPILKHFRRFESISKRGYDDIRKITFPEFMQYLITSGSNETTPVMDSHWDNYANLCNMCAVDYDFIAHYETLEEDLAAFKEATKDRKYKDSSKRKSFESGVVLSDTASELIKYYSKIPLEWIKTLGLIYKSSFEMFGYSFPGPLQSLFETKN